MQGSSRPTFRCAVSAAGVVLPAPGARASARRRCSARTRGRWRSRPARWRSPSRVASERIAAVYAVLLPAIFLAGIAREQIVASPDAATMRSRTTTTASRCASAACCATIRKSATRRSGSPSPCARSSAPASGHEASGGVLVRAPLLPEYRAGDVVELEGKLETPPQLEDFDYAAYLARRGIAQRDGVSGRRASSDTTSRTSRAALLLDARRTLSDGLALALPEPQASLAQGVLLGERSALPDGRARRPQRDEHVASGRRVRRRTSCSCRCTRRCCSGCSFGRRRALALSIGRRRRVCGARRAIAAGVSRDGDGHRADPARRCRAGASNGLTSLLLAAAIMCGLQPSVLARCLVPAQLRGDGGHPLPGGAAAARDHRCARRGDRTDGAAALARRGCSSSRRR